PRRLLPGLVAVEAKDRLVRHLPQQRELVFGQRGAERSDARRKARAHHGDDVDITFHYHQRAAVMGGEPRGAEVVEIVALVKQGRLRRVQVFGGDVFFQRAAAKRDDPAAQIRDRKHHAVAKAIIGYRDVVARDQQTRLDHVLDRNALGSQIFLQRKTLARRIADAELQLGGRRNGAVAEIAARLGAVARGQSVGEEFRGQFHHIVQRLAALLVTRGVGSDGGQRHAGHRGQPFDRFGEADALGLHQERDDVAVLAGGEVVIKSLLVVDGERRRLLLLE